MAGRGSRASHGAGYHTRLQGTREQRKRFLILCEGSKTEPNYFRRFPASIDVESPALDPLGLVQQAVVRQAQAKRERAPYDQVWCVFDRDEWTRERFNQAIALARQKGIHVAYSNQAFELWYLLHFNYCDTACARSEFSDRLTDQLRFRYAKNYPDLYSVLMPRQDTAIRNAERLLAQYDPPDPANNDPSTTVHLLVKALRASSRP